MKDKVYIASDHAGFKAKEEVKVILEKLNFDYEDLGTYTENKAVDYPLYAEKVAEKIIHHQNCKGILICGSGTGMQITANKIKGIRAAFSYDKYSAEMARKDNDANILTLRGREFDHSKYEVVVKTFLKTEFSGKKRHKKRIEEITKIENRY